MAHIHNHKEVVGGHNSAVNAFFWLGNLMAFIWAMREDIGHAIVIVLFTTTVGWGYKKVLNMIDRKYTRDGNNRELRSGLNRHVTDSDSRVD